MNLNLKISATAKTPAKTTAEILAIPVFLNSKTIQPQLPKLSDKINALLLDLAKSEHFKGEKNTSIRLFTKGSLPADQVVIFGLGEQSKWSLDVLRKSCGLLAKTCLKGKKKNLAVLLPNIDASNYRYNASPEEMAQAVAEGVGLGCYRFSKYRKTTPNSYGEIQSLQLLCKNKSLEKSVLLGAKRGNIFAHATRLARDLVNEPPNKLTPQSLAKAAKNFLKNSSVKTSILSKPEIQKLGLNAYLAVSQGSHHPPAFIRMTYTPTKKAKRHIVLVGKGVTFDSGGLSLKTAKGMETMKDDMAGAAAVIGVMAGLTRLKPAVKVTSLVLATENMPDAQSVKPGDVVKSYLGKTIEILNTDAEGRLTLADGLAYACKTQKPDQIIDIATLTGACLVALGDSISAVMGNNDSMIQKIRESGNQQGENFWQLPLHEEYRDLLKSEFADLKNIGGSYGGAITAALFLSEFVDGCDWAHLDIAGPAWSDKEMGIYSKGGTGVGVRTLLNYLCSHT